MWDLDAIAERSVRERYRAAADLLLERLLTEGLPHRIQIEDIERLLDAGKRETFMRSIIIELMLCLRIKK